MGENNWNLPKNPSEHFLKVVTTKVVFFVVVLFSWPIQFDDIFDIAQHRATSRNLPRSPDFFTAFLHNALCTEFQVTEVNNDHLLVAIFGMFMF